MVEAIRLNNVVKRFGKVTAVDHVSFAEKEAETLTLLGPSGCGKTTALRIIAGLEDLDEGEVFLDGKMVSSSKKGVFVQPEKRRLGLVFQSYALWPHMTVYKNIAYGLKAQKVPKEEIRQKVRATLELVNLPGLEDRYPSQLSGGQQQRVALARNLVYEPKVLLLDEPLSNLDLRERERMRGELRRLLREIKITALYVTHDQEEAFIISDRIIVMDEGKILQQGTPNEIYENPRDLFVAGFIGRANIFKASIKSIDAHGQSCIVEVPKIGAELISECYNQEFTKEERCLIIIRPNQIGMYSSKPKLENLVVGKITDREYRGTITDHKVSIGSSELLVTTHQFCPAVKLAPNAKRIYLHIPPRGIKMLPIQ